MKRFSILALLCWASPVHANLVSEEIFFLKNKQSSPSFSTITSPFSDETVTTDPLKLLAAAEDALHFLISGRGMRDYDAIVKANHPELSNDRNFKVDHLFTRRARQTLQFIIATIRDDRFHKRPHRITDPQFLNKHFTFISWKPDQASAEKNKVALDDPTMLRTTKYAVFTTSGSPVKTAAHPCALYTFAPDTNPDSLRFTFTKQDVVGGCLERAPYKSMIRSLVWVSRDGLEEALMQGTISVTLPDGSSQLFSVDKNNGIPYDRSLKEKGRREQKRYWYFKQISLEYDSTQACAIKHGGIACAGDLYNIGLGKIIALKHTDERTGRACIRLCTLVDTGGAFAGNTYQIDQFAGIFENAQDMYDKTSHLPRSAQAFVMIRK